MVYRALLRQPPNADVGPTEDVSVFSAVGPRLVGPRFAAALGARMREAGSELMCEGVRW